jgi:glycosyltransferase involved in cell wall biosynthesis
MSTGLPVVATDAGSITEVIPNGHEGRLVPQRDPNALAAAMEALLQSPKQRKQLGQAAADNVRDRFDVRTCERAFHERLKDLISNRRNRSSALRS